jgi:hypothetical protein
MMSSYIFSYLKLLYFMPVDMLNINNIAVDEELLTVRFACDLGKCHGACCTLDGGRGAPLKDDEVEQIYRFFPAVEKYLPAEHRAVIEREGLVEGVPGSFATVCHDRRACVFVYYENSVAKCAFERAFLNNETTWRKPVSCHLFPLRVRIGTIPALRYEPIRECTPAVQRGESENVKISDFLSESLRTAFGREWYAQLQTIAGPHAGGNGTDTSA